MFGWIFRLWILVWILVGWFGVEHEFCLPCRAERVWRVCDGMSIVKHWRKSNLSHFTRIVQHLCGVFLCNRTVFFTPNAICAINCMASIYCHRVRYSAKKNCSWLDDEHWAAVTFHCLTCGLWNYKIKHQQIIIIAGVQRSHGASLSVHRIRLSKFNSRLVGVQRSHPCVHCFQPPIFAESWWLSASITHETRLIENGKRKCASTLTWFAYQICAYFVVAQIWLTICFLLTVLNK